MQKWVYFLREYTWMRRGTQGHVAAPRGPAQVLAWHWGDTLYIYIFYYIGYSKYKLFHRGTSLTYEFTSPYISDDSSCFSPCGTMFPRFLWLQDAWHDVAHRMGIAMKIARRWGGHEVHSIKTIDRASYNGWDHARSVDSSRHHER